MNADPPATHKILEFQSKTRMIPINDLSNTELQKLRIACSYLFSTELAGDDEFLKKLKLVSVKNAFREKEKRYDPALHGDEPEEMLKRRKDRLVKIRESYEILKLYIPEEQKFIHKPGAKQGRIIAVGGAKGGTGKSIFAANLGVLLSSRGRRTVLVDLDLGGANLHLYLGESSLRYNINDFLNKRVTTLEEITIPTKHGPYLIGGDSAQLGAANIHFLRKLKLMKAIREIDADDIIIDLGGDTSYNVIDFFLAADHGLVLTTCDPASYLDAYSFIKVALFRKLDRIFGPESEFRNRKDQDLEWLINDTMGSENGNKGKFISNLLRRIKETQPGNLSLISEVLDSFQPFIIGNMTEDESALQQVVHRIQKVSQKMLSIQVGYLGCIPSLPEIKRSAQDLVPIVAKEPDGVFSNCIGDMMDRI